MAYFLDHNSNYVPSGQKVFYCDEPSDIDNLPTSKKEGAPQNGTVTDNKVQPGSSCLCISTGDLYILNSNDEWVLM